MEMIMIKRFIALIFTLLVLGFSPSLQMRFIVETLKQGKGDFATANKQISVHYEGKLIDGQFLMPRARGAAIQLHPWERPGDKGLDLGVEGMAIGEIRRLTIPPELGYGATGLGG